jgi:hypothetical protein
VEPALRSYAHQKMIKVALAACVFSSCSLSRAYVMLREAFTPDAPALSPLTYLTLAVEVPELLPTLAALLVLRRRPIACTPCSQWCARCAPAEEGRACARCGLGSWCDVGGGCADAVRAATAWCLAWPRSCCARHVDEVDRTPLRLADSLS